MTLNQIHDQVMDALCHSQITEYVCGRDTDDNTVEIRWVGDEWQIVKYLEDGTEVSYEEGGLERTLGWLMEVYPEILVDMHNELGLEETVE